jgi:hypothetical protein
MQPPTTGLKGGYFINWSNFLVKNWVDFEKSNAVSPKRIPANEA